VGNAICSVMVIIFFPDHPHTRGERASSSGAAHRNGGSSPHAWGTLLAISASATNERIIPTRVGNAHGWSRSRCHRPDHPHTRGERFNSVAYKGPSLGSSPHAWGTPEVLCKRKYVRRIIPTRVGNASIFSHRSPSLPDHPHTRGERADTAPLIPSDRGSSPHAWGTPLAVVSLPS